MRVEKTFSRFRYSFSLEGPDREGKIVVGPVGPRLYLNEHDRVAVEAYYINFPASCPPVAAKNGPTITRKLKGCLFLAGPARLGARRPFRHRDFWYSEGSMARAMNMV